MEIFHEYQYIIVMVCESNSNYFLLTICVILILINSTFGNEFNMCRWYKMGWRAVKSQRGKFKNSLSIVIPQQLFRRNITLNNKCSCTLHFMSRGKYKHIHLTFIIVTVFDSLFFDVFCFTGTKKKKKMKPCRLGFFFLVILYRSFTLDTVMLLA